MRANLVECSDHDVIYGVLTVENVSAEEVQKKFTKLRTMQSF